MVVADQMQQPVREQERYLAFEVMAVGSGLARGGVERDDDVTEQPGQAAVLPIARWWVELEGEYVGGPILGSVRPVEFADGRVVRQVDAEFCSLQAKAREHAVSCPLHPAGGQRGTVRGSAGNQCGHQNVDTTYDEAAARASFAPRERGATFRR